MSAGMICVGKLVVIGVCTKISVLANLLCERMERLGLPVLGLRPPPPTGPSIPRRWVTACRSGSATSAG